MSEPDINYEADASPAGVNQLAPEELKRRLRADAARVAVLNARLAELAEATIEVTTERNRILREKLTDLMAQYGSSAWKDEDTGLVVEVKPRIGGKLSSAEDPDAAVKYLVDEGMSGSIKVTLTISYAHEEFDEAEAAAELLSKVLGRQVVMKSDIHHSTLASWALNRVKDAVATNLKILGLTTWREASIKEK